MLLALAITVLRIKVLLCGGILGITFFVTVQTGFLEVNLSKIMAFGDPKAWTMGDGLVSPLGREPPVAPRVIALSPLIVTCARLFLSTIIW